MPTDPYTQPKTAAELQALPIGPVFGQEERVIDGRTVRVPVMKPTQVFYLRESDPMSWVDADGRWILGRYADGTWFKQRIG